MGKLHNVQQYKLYSSSNSLIFCEKHKSHLINIRGIKLGWIGWVGHVVRMGKTRKHTKLCLENLKGRNYLRVLVSGSRVVFELSFNKYDLKLWA